MSHHPQNMSRSLNITNCPESNSSTSVKKFWSSNFFFIPGTLIISDARLVEEQDDESGKNKQQKQNIWFMTLEHYTREQERCCSDKRDRQ